MTSTVQSHSNKEIVLAAYAAANHGDVDAFFDMLDAEFQADMPPVLAWGGVTHGPEEFRDKVLPLLGAAIDLSTIRVDTIAAEGDHVVTLLTMWARTGEELRVTEHWTLRDGKLRDVLVFHYDTTPLLGNPAPAA